MDGREFAKIIERELANRSIRKGDFYTATGISATALYGWKRGATPSQETIDAAEKSLGSSFADCESQSLREDLRDDLKVLLKSAEDLPPSSVYELIAEIHRRKEAGKVEPSS